MSNIRRNDGFWSYHAAPQTKRAYRALKREIGSRQARRLTRLSYALRAIA